MSKITPCLWYDGQAEEAARFYVTLLPDSRVDRVLRSPAATPSGPEGYPLLVDFTRPDRSSSGSTADRSSRSPRRCRSRSRPPTRPRPTGSGRH